MLSARQSTPCQSSGPRCRAVSHSGISFELFLSVHACHQARVENRQGLQSLHPELLERRLAHLELGRGESMRDAVRDYVSRVRSARPWDDQLYPRGIEKELYAQFAYIVLSNPATVIAALFEEFKSPVAAKLLGRPLIGSWRAYRVSRVRRDRGTRWRDPLILPGCAGRGAIADVALLLNPSFAGDQKQVSADLSLYFELKSRDRHRQEAGQLRSHLQAIESDPAAGEVYLAGIGGKCSELQHSRWIGHISLDQFFTAVSRVSENEGVLAGEISEVKRIVLAPARRRKSALSSAEG